MKPISLTVYEEAQDVVVLPDGESAFCVYTSNMCDGEMDQAMKTLVRIWDLSTEVNLTVQARTRTLLKTLTDLYADRDGVIDAEGVPLFQALKRDCEWMVEQINNLKVHTDENN